MKGFFKILIVLIIAILLLAAGYLILRREARKETKTGPKGGVLEKVVGTGTTAIQTGPTYQSGPINLEILYPADGATITNSRIVLKGKTSPDAEVFVNDIEGKADKSGNFSISLTLDEGENTINVSVNDAEGNFAEKEINIIYNPNQ